MSRFDRPPRHRLPERAEMVVRAIGGVCFIVAGFLFASTQNIEYAPGDLRGTQLFGVITGGLAILIGVLSLLSIRFRRLRGGRHRDGE